VNYNYASEIELMEFEMKLDAAVDEQMKLPVHNRELHQPGIDGLLQTFSEMKINMDKA